ncbi:MAG TPA: hypothetical protein VL860_05020 [Planctomycetota bacterium]|nr:hypothetical protein [Planctomycetota bacterium]
MNAPLLNCTRLFCSFFTLVVLLVFTAGCGNQEQAIRDAHAAYEKAWAAKDIAAIKACVTKRKVKGLDDPAAKLVVDMADKIRPTSVSITGIDFPGEDVAELKLTAKQNGAASTGSIRMKREEGTWKVDNEDWKIEMAVGPGGIDPEAERPFIQPVSPTLLKVMDDLAGDDPVKAGNVWLKFAAGYTSAKPFLKECGAGFNDSRPIHFDLEFESFTDNAGHTNRYVTTHLKPIDEAKNPQAKTVGEALRIPLWALEDVGNSKFDGEFAAWYQGYAEQKHLK